ncbi:hypothetical protein SCG7086_CL_00070 [Chlamydiales bacterium SCGC AG-110-P3]|nr:hypothetical protein SCG7086_CL_00070 [Chlamydiales bacterium SCGC AG-110-P3]
MINQEIDEHKHVELGYRLATAYWGKGLATEASLAIRDYAFEMLGLDDLISIIDPKNVRSAGVALKVGMTSNRGAIFHGQHVQIYELNRLVVKPYM